MDGNCPFDQETKDEIDDYKAMAAQTEKDRESYYKEFRGWAEEYKDASPKRKQIIIGQLFNRMELYGGYKVKMYLNLSYKE